MRPVGNELEFDLHKIPIQGLSRTKTNPMGRLSQGSQIFFRDLVVHWTLFYTKSLIAAFIAVISFLHIVGSAYSPPPSLPSILLIGIQKHRTFTKIYPKSFIGANLFKVWYINNHHFSLLYLQKQGKISFFQRSDNYLRGVVWICWRTSNKKHSLKCLNVWPYKSASL